MRKLTHEEIVRRQEEQKTKPRLALTVVLNNIRSLYNVGSIFRTSDGAGVEKIYICGITGHPPDKQISKTALGAEAAVPWEYHKDIVPVLEGLKKKKYEVVMLEQMGKSIPHEEYCPRFPVCLVVGNEIGGVDPDVLSLCDVAVEIEMMGLKNSLNVSVAYGIMAYHIRSQFRLK